MKTKEIKNMSDDWHCSACGGDLCRGCGYCPSCEWCHCE